MGKLPHRRMKQAEQDHTGCMWGFISMFDFRRGGGGYNRRLLPEKRFGNRVLGDAGLSPKMMSLKENDYPLDDDDCESTQPMLGAGKPSVKKLMEQDMIVDDKRKDNIDGVESGDSDFECQSHKKSSKLHQQKLKHFSISSVTELEDVANDAVINNAVQEIFSRIQQKRDGEVVHENDRKDDFRVLSEKKKAKFEKQLIESAEVILHEKLPIGQDKKICYSREFMDALETLISHKLLFIKLLEDPNSALTRHINFLVNAEQGKNVIQKDSEGSHSRKHRLFSRRRVRSQEVVLLTENEGAVTPSHGAFLAPRLEALSTAIPFNNPAPSLRTKSIFSFTEIKRRLKHAMGKDKDGVSAKSEIVKKVSRGNQVMRPGGETVLGRMSPSRNPHLEAEIHPKRLSSPRKSEVDSPSQQKISNSYVDPNSKHTSPVPIDDDGDPKISNRQDMEFARTSSSASDHTSSNNFSHIMESGCTSPTADKRFSSPRKSFNSNKNSEVLGQDTNVNAAEDLSSQSSLVTTSESDDTFSTKLESWDPSPIISDHKSFEEEDELQYSVQLSPEGNTKDLIPQTAEVTPLKLNTDESTEYPPNTDESTEYPPSCDIVKSEDTREVVDTVIITDTDEQDENKENCTAPSQITLAHSCLDSDKTELADGFTIKMEKPSPISVLDPVFLDDEISPPSTKILQDGLPVAPLQIRFDEDDFAESDKSTFDQKYIDDNESKRNYILEILKLSGFSWDTIYLRSLSSEQLLDASLYDADVDIFSDQPSNEYKLLFDCSNEVLMDTCGRYFGGCPLTSFSKHNIRPIPGTESAFREIWKGVEWHLRPLSPPRSLEQMVEKDLAKDGRWMDLRFDAETIGNELEDVILRELLEDTVLCCSSEETENRLQNVY